MPYIQSRKRRAERPYRLRLNRQHPLSQDLIFAAIGNATSERAFLDSSPNRNHADTVAPAGPPLLIRNYGRIGGDCTGANRGIGCDSFQSLTYPFSSSALIYCPTNTIERIFNVTASGGGNSFCLSRVTGGQAGIRCNVGGGSYSNSLTPIPSGPIWMCITGNFISATERYAWVDGVKTNPDTSNKTPTNPMDQVWYGRVGPTGTYDQGAILDGMVWDRALTEDEHLLLADRDNIFYDGFIQQEPTVVYFLPTGVAPPPTPKYKIFKSPVIRGVA